ncbi:MAG: hypothetical protein RL748_1481 [Pseudomonadota bacterium]|jgi:hypothetical protein
MVRKFWISLVAVFIVNMLLSFIEHGILLKDDYAALPFLMRSEQESQAFFGWMLLGQFMICTAFVWVYQHGLEDKPWLPQGLHFGLVGAAFSTIPHHLIYHAVAKFPTDLMIKQVVLDIPVMLCMGVVVAWVHRHKG